MTGSLLRSLFQVMAYTPHFLMDPCYGSLLESGGVCSMGHYLARGT